MNCRVLSRGHWPSLVGAWLHFEVSFMVWLLVGALGIAIAEEFQLGPTQKGLLVAVPLLGGALLRVVVGPLTDWYGAKQVGTGILWVEIAALAIGWRFGDSYLHMLVTGFLLGFAGASFAIALPIASNAYPPEHQGLAMGIAAVGNSGVLLATFFAPRIAEIFGWRTTFGLMMIPVFATMAVFQWVIPRDVRKPAGKQETHWLVVLRRNIQQPFMYGLCFFYAITFGGFVGFSSFLPIFFHDQYGMDIISAGSVTALCGLAGSFARPFGGHLADKFGGLNLLQGMFPVVMILCFIQYGLLPPVWAIPLMILMVLVLGFGNGIVFQVVSLKFHGMMGTASGIIGAAGGLGGFLLPFCFGVLKDLTGSYGIGFILVGLCAGGGLIGAFRLQRYVSVPLEAPAK